MKYTFYLALFFLSEIHRKGTEAELQIVSGDEAPIGSIPYQAYIKFFNSSDSWICGGSLVSIKYVLTSARCTYTALSATVTLGAYNITLDSEPTRQIFNTSKIIPHEDFNEDVYFNDVALIELDNEVTITPNVNIIEMASNDSNLNDQVAVISGWGRTYSFDPFSQTLRMGKVEVIDVRICEEIYYDLVRRERQICTIGAKVSNVTNCGGDFGGPVVINNTLYGVQSFASPLNFCLIGYPSISSKVSFYLDWIKSIIHS